MENTKIGKISLGKIPRIVAVIDDFYPMERIHGLKEKGADLIEIRVDCLKKDNDTIYNYINKIKENISIPSIGTIRETEHNRLKRFEMFKTVIPFVDAIDIEIDTDITRDVIACASTKTVIVSEHDFNKTPDINNLNRIVDRATKMGADIIKIAALADNRQDVLRLLHFTEKCQKKNLVTIAMGEIGKITRIIAPLFGSLFSYCYISREVAPGQLSLEKMEEEFSLYYPEFRENR